MKRVLRCATLVIALFVCLIASSHRVDATAVKHATLDALVENATRVVQVKVTSENAAWDADKRRIWTTYNVQVIDTLKGESVFSFPVRVRGGEVGDRAQYIPGAPRLEVDSEYVLFTRLDNDEKYQILAMGQGRFNVTREEGEDATVINSMSGVRVIQTEEGTEKPSPISDTLENFKTRVRDLVDASEEEDEEALGGDEAPADEDEGEGE